MLLNQVLHPQSTHAMRESTGDYYYSSFPWAHSSQNNIYSQVNKLYPPCKIIMHSSYHSSPDRILPPNYIFSQDFLSLYVDAEKSNQKKSLIVLVYLITLWLKTKALYGLVCVIAKFRHKKKKEQNSKYKSIFIHPKKESNIKVYWVLLWKSFFSSIFLEVYPLKKEVLGLKRVHYTYNFWS